MIKLKYLVLILIILISALLSHFEFLEEFNTDLIKNNNTEHMSTTNRDLLTGENRKNQISSLNNWVEADNRDAIKKSFAFKDFKEAFNGFMTQVGDVAEEVKKKKNYTSKK